MASLVFVEVDKPDDFRDELAVESSFNQCFVAELFFDVALQDGVEQVVRRKRVGVLLIWAQFGGGRALNRVPGMTGVSD